MTIIEQERKRIRDIEKEMTLLNDKKKVKTYDIDQEIDKLRKERRLILNRGYLRTHRKNK